MQTLDETSSDRLSQQIWDAINEGATLKDMHGVSQEMMDGIYAYAYHFYHSGRLEEAEAFFHFLCIYDFYNADYIMGLAAVFHLKKQYKKASDLYALAFAQGKSNYAAIFYIGQCQLSMRKAVKAKQCFEVVQEFSTDESLIEKTKVYLDALAEVEGADVSDVGEED